MKNFPARTKRNISIAKLKESFEQTPGGGNDAGGGALILAGRIIGILDDGFVLQDESGRLDIESREKVNAGDIVEVKVIREKRVGEPGMEVIVYVDKGVFVLAPCRSDFFVGKSSPNYLKCVIDANFKEKLRMRTLLTGKIREFFLKEGFMEAETPEMVRLPGMEPHLDVFKTSFRSWQAEGEEDDMFLITSPEYAMKKLLVAGFEKVFQICKSFRNKEHLSELHNPEFTMIEWYRAFASYEDIMIDTENLVKSLCREFCGGEALEFNGQKVDVAGPWERKKVKDLFEEYAGIAVADFEDPERFRKAVAGKGYKVNENTLYEDLFFEVFLNEIEPKLGLKKPVIVYEYPVSMAALSKSCEHDPRYAERFEVYIAGLELCNAFTELNDPDEQKARLEAERSERKKMGKEDYAVDQSFIDALAFGMPPAGGIALGVDRLAMLVLGVKDINDILFFPHREL